jgi:hypothetical protein
MNPFVLFRLSVVAPVPLCIAGVVYASWSYSSFSQNWRDLIAWNGDGGMLPNYFTDASVMTWAFMALVAVMALITLVNQVLFYFYWRYSRVIYLISFITSFPATLLLGLSITTPVENVLNQMATFMSGMALALAYFSPVAERFRRGEEIKQEVIS